MQDRPLRVSEPLALAVGAAVLTALIVGLAPPGTDFAAHAYQSAVFARQGFGIWDNGWYAGRCEFVTYSVRLPERDHRLLHARDRRLGGQPALPR